MPQKQRLRVWNGDLKKTSGGLTKKDLIKNKRGKIVSKKKNSQASSANNLGKWLRKSGDAFEAVPQGAESKKEKEVQPSHVKKEAAAKKAPKAPKPMVYKPKPKPPKQAPKPKPKRKRAEPMKAGEKKDLSKISVGNIHVEKDPIQDWPDWAKKMAKSSPAVKEEMLEKFDIWEGDWSDMETYFGGGSLKTGTRGRKKKKMLKEKVKARLKATRRRGKRRHKKTLLRDVLDV